MYKYDFSCYFHTPENRMEGVGCRGSTSCFPARLALSLCHLHLCFSLEHLLSSFPHSPLFLFSPSCRLSPRSPPFSPALSPALALSLPPCSFLAPDLPSPMPPLGPGSLQGGTDLEKHRDLLMVENERLRQEMRRCEAELQELRGKPGAACTGCEHSQVSAGPGGPGGLSS